MDLYGRKKNVIPISIEEFNKNPIFWIKKYLTSCIKTNKQNKEEYDYLLKIYKGNQEIKDKIRLNGSDDNNNKEVFNHIFKQVEFKKGFMVGNPIEYSNANSKNTNDDMMYLNKYLRDCKKASKDIVKYEQLYICGVSNTFVMPQKKDTNIDKSPFIYSILEPFSSFVVYGNDIDDEPLFNVVISNELDNEYKTKTIYTIYYIKDSDEYCYGFKIWQNRNGELETSREEKQQTYKFLPITEFTLNNSRMGIIELVISIQNMLNTIRSNQTDSIVDFVNSYLVFENQDFKSPQFMKVFEELRKKRVLGITSTNPNFPAKVSILKDTLQNNDINELYNDAKQEMYDIVSVPLSSGNVTSGGDTGQARLLGNGWESAQNQANVDKSYLTQFEYDLLEKFISICKDKVGNPIDKIEASDIEIKFSINMSNNLLVKAQSLKYLYDMNVPYEEALIMTGITGDTHGIGNKWKSRDEEIKKLDTSNNE